MQLGLRDSICWGRDTGGYRHPRDGNAEWNGRCSGGDVYQKSAGGSTCAMSFSYAEAQVRLPLPTPNLNTAAIGRCSPCRLSQRLL